MSTRRATVPLSPEQVAVLVEALEVCLNSDTFLDDQSAYVEADLLLVGLKALP